MTITLHCFGESGNAYKAALALTLAGIDWTPSHVDFFNGAARSPEFRALNPMGEVPVLEAGGLVLTQSGVIQDWVMDETGKLCGDGSKPTRREILRWTIFDNQKVSGLIGPLRFMRTLAKTGETEVTKFLDGRSKAALAILEKHFDSSAFAVGERPTIADFSLCSYLYYDGELGFDLDAYPNVTQWLARIKSLPGWKHPYDLMPGHPLPNAT